MPRLEKEAKNNKAAVAKIELLKRLAEWMDEGHRAAKMEMTAEERALVYDLHLLTMKPMLYVANVDESQVADALRADRRRHARFRSARRSRPTSPSSSPRRPRSTSPSSACPSPASTRSSARRTALLGLQSYFTAGVQEVRAWTVPIGAKAPQAAGVIHTDFERGFIKAEVISFEDYVALGGEKGAKEAGKMRLEGKEYVMADGDVVHFKFNV